MIPKNYSCVATALLSLFLIHLACSPPAPQIVASKPDMEAVKREIQAIETAFAAADNARDINALLAFYSDDAVAMGHGEPMAVGKAAIRKRMVEGFAKNVTGSTVEYHVIEVFGDESLITEIGKSKTKDISGTVTSTGKYMALWEKRDGKYLCIRDISNSDTKEN